MKIKADAMRLWEDGYARHFDRYVRGELTYQEQRRERVRDLFGSPLLTDPAADGYFREYYEGYLRSCALFPDVRPFLKPQPEIFHLAIQGLGVARQTEERISGWGKGYRRVGRNPRPSFQAMKRKIPEHDYFDMRETAGWSLTETRSEFMEIWDVLDAGGNRTGRKVERGEPLLPGEFHLVVDIWVRNRNGKYLISKRAQGKSYPGMWETTGGCALAGEKSLTAALREVKEEVGLDLTPTAGRIIHRTLGTRSQFPSFLEIWLFEENVFDVEPRCQAEEVSEAKWAAKSEILGMLDAGVFLSHLSPRLEELD
jgi:8-oxo-dGTP diphosphatase